MLNQLIKNAQPYWQQYVEHDFVKQLANGSLPAECFRHYLKQDYLYLFHYSRAFALAIFKAKNFSQMETPRKSLESICQEIQLHLAYCRQWGISEAEIFTIQESLCCLYPLFIGLRCYRWFSGNLCSHYALCRRLRTNCTLYHRKLPARSQ